MAAAAFFDMDMTVLTVNSGTLWMKHLRQREEISRARFLKSFWWALLYKLSLLDMDVLSKRLVASVAGGTERDMIDKCRSWFSAEIAHTVAPRARAAIERHRQKGDHVVLLTTSTPYVAGLLAQALTMPVICSELEVKDGVFTGRIVEPLCFGRGKLFRAERWARANDVDLGRSTFYTDSYSDLPMLERVGVPVAINPDPRLLRTARRRGWPIEKWNCDA